MTRFEYKVVPAPAKGVKARGVKRAEGRFSHALELLMNDMGRDGWEYQRAETLPSEERSGLTSSVTVWRHVLVFRRPAVQDAGAYDPLLLDPPAPPQPQERPEATRNAVDAAEDSLAAATVVAVDGPEPHAPGTDDGKPPVLPRPEFKPDHLPAPEPTRQDVPSEPLVLPEDNGVEGTHTADDLGRTLTERAARLREIKHD